MTKESKNSRRRGEELTSAIFEATVEILERDGYEAVTFQSVAKVAHTTRSVIYRYFEDNFDLIYRASRWSMMQKSDWQGTVVSQIFNIGSLREDLLAMARFMAHNSGLFPKNFLPYIFFQQSQGRSIFEDQLGDITLSNLTIINQILEQAAKRGETRTNIGEAAKLLPFQMSRYHIMVENKPMDEAAIIRLVDDVLIPMYRKIDR